MALIGPFREIVMNRRWWLPGAVLAALQGVAGCQPAAIGTAAQFGTEFDGGK